MHVTTFCHKVIKVKNQQALENGYYMAGHAPFVLLEHGWQSLATCVEIVVLGTCRTLAEDDEDKRGNGN